MKISCLQENLSRGLAIVGHAVANRATLPITQNVLLSSDQGMLRLSATNLEIAMTTWIGAMVEEEGATTVPARVLSQFVNSLRSDRIDLNLEEDSHQLQIKSGRSQANINGTEAAEFPPIPVMEDAVTARAGSKELRTAISRVALAAATEESRPVLTGVEVRLRENAFTMAAADGFRLAVHHGTLTQSLPEEMSVIIPARTMNELNRLLAGRDETVEIMLTPQAKQIMFRVQGDNDTVELLSQLLNGTFPNYDQLVPQSRTTRAILDSQATLQATRTAAVFARDGSDIIRMHLTPHEDDQTPGGRLLIAARSEIIGDEQDELDLAELEGEEVKIALNSNYLRDALSALGRDQQVAIETTTSSNPAVFKPVDDSDKYVHVVMPMFVQW